MSYYSATSWTVARQFPLSMEFSRQEYWSGLPFPSPADLLKLGIEPESLALQADSLLSEPQGKPGINTYTLLYIKQIISKDLPCSTGSCICSDLYGKKT